MEHSKNKTWGVAAVVVALIVGLVVGWAITYGVEHKSSNSNSSMTAAASDKAVGLNTSLVALGVQHMNYTDQAVDAALDGSPNAKALATLLYNNGNQIGAAVGSVYGQSAETTFDSVWKLHLDEFVAYAVADSQGDQAGMSAALNKIKTGYTIPLAQFLAKANPYLPESVLQSSLDEHVQMTAQMINDHVNKDYTAEANELDMSNQHIAGLMSTLAGAIVKQFPNKF